MAWLKFRGREILFREAVLAFMGVGSAAECSVEGKKICEAQFGEFLDWACKKCEKKNA
jgi:hypothetical protein